METLTKLFGSQAKIKIMRLFLLNTETAYETKDVVTRSRVQAGTVKRELASLHGAGLIKKKQFKKSYTAKKGSKTVLKTKSVSGWVMDKSFPYQDALYNLLIDAEFIDLKTISERFKGAGKIKLMLVSGVFIQHRETRVDLLIVGDHLKKTVIDRAIKILESEIGKELTYAVFETPDFLYRAHMYDKLVRDIIDFPHHKVIDGGILSQVPKIA